MCAASLFTAEEAFLLHVAVTERVKQIEPPPGRKGTKDTRWQLRQYDSILRKLEDNYPPCRLMSHLPSDAASRTGAPQTPDIPHIDD